MPSLTACLLRTSVCTALLLSMQPLMAAPDTCLHDSPSVCPEWLPSAAEVSKTFKAYYKQRVKRGLLELRVGPVVHTSMSTISCGALGERAGSNFVCGATLTFWDLFGRKHMLQSSPTFRIMENGNLAIHEQGQWVEPDI